MTSIANSFINISYKVIINFKKIYTFNIKLINNITILFVIANIISKKFILNNFINITYLTKT